MKKFTKLNKIKKKKIILSVTNDLTTDQRMHKIATTLLQMGLDVTLIGRKLSTSQDLNRAYKTVRLPMFFTKKMWFYAEYNIRLFFYLLFHSFDAFVANDLDTLLANYWLSKLKRKTLFYDSHEYFTEVPELITRPKIRNVWLKIEHYVFPKLKNVYTVNETIARIYKEKYAVDIKVVRNIAPKLKNKKRDLFLAEKLRKDKKYMLIMQGAGINMDRGAEELIQAMQYVENAILYIIGSGDVFPQLRKMQKELSLFDKVIIKDRMPYQDLIEYTKVADLGFSLDKGTNPNYEYSLPNKVFDYIQAEIPLLVSNRKHVASLVKENKIGFVIKEVESTALAKTINDILQDKDILLIWRENLKLAAEKYNWEKESEQIREIYKDLL